MPEGPPPYNHHSVVDSGTPAVEDTHAGQAHTWAVAVAPMRASHLTLTTPHPRDINIANHGPCRRTLTLQTHTPPHISDRPIFRLTYTHLCMPHIPALNPHHRRCGIETRGLHAPWGVGGDWVTCMRSWCAWARARGLCTGYAQEWGCFVMRVRSTMRPCPGSCVVAVRCDVLLGHH